MVFTAIPLASVTAFLPSVLSTSNPTEGLLSCLGILSLLATAYTMRHSPLRPDRKGKKPVTAEDERLALIRTALLPVNGVVCLLLTAAYFLIGPYASRPVLYLVPGGESYNVLLAMSRYSGHWPRLHPLALSELNVYSHACDCPGCAGNNAFGRSFGSQRSSVRVQGSIGPSNASSLELSWDSYKSQRGTNLEA